MTYEEAVVARNSIPTYFEREFKIAKHFREVVL
jgi:hypothetical protein